jgi:hypothetical protein
MGKTTAQWHRKMSLSSAAKGHAMTRSLALVASAVLAACAATNEGPVQSLDEQRCEQEVRIGSSIPTTKCVNRVVAQQEKRDAEHIADRIRRAPARTTGSVSATGD